MSGIRSFELDSGHSKDRPDIPKQYDTGLFENLRILRKQLADKQGVPPFVIFSDVALHEMSHYFPCDRENFSNVKGVGEKKLEDFSEIFMTAIKKHVKDNNLSSIDIPTNNQRKNRKIQREAQNDTSRYGKTKQMLLKKFSLSEIANKHGFTQGTIINHIEKLIDSGEKLDINYLTPTDGSFEKIRKAITICGDARLKPIHDFLKEEHSYDEIRLVRLLSKAA